jgi:hypothetical protein
MTKLYPKCGGVKPVNVIVDKSMWLYILSVLVRLLSEDNI